MTPVMLGLLCALIVAAAAVFYFWVVRRRQDESIEGVRSLNALRWREFAGMVLEMMIRRGYAPAEAHPLGSGDQSDILLKRDQTLFLLSCKHGSAYRLGGQAVDELANSIRMNDAAGGMLVTPGAFAPDAQAHAKPQRIELIDGQAIWPEIEPLISEPVRQHVRAYAAARAKRGVGIGLTAAIVVGAAAALLAPGRDDAMGTPAAAATAQTPAPQPAPTAKPAEQPVAPAAAPSEKQVEQRRSDIAGAIAALPGVERAIWSTQSTLVLDIGNERSDLWAGICGILDRYEELRATRVQINPPPGSGAQVRFKQCHTY